MIKIITLISIILIIDYDHDEHIDVHNDHDEHIDVHNDHS